MQTIVFLHKVEAIQKDDEGKVSILLTSGKILEVGGRAWDQLRAVAEKSKFETVIFGEHKKEGV